MAAENHPLVAEKVLEAPERDRLFREWILPHLKLTDAHRDFVEAELNIPGARDFHSFPGPVKVPLDEHAPVARLKKLTCCTISDSEMELSGPMAGALLVPVQDPHGRLTAFRLLENNQVDKIKAGDAAGIVRWWHAASTMRPMMPNGDSPLHAVRVSTSDTVVLIKGIARASAVAARWKKSAISTVEPNFPAPVVIDYIRELCGTHIELFMHRTPSLREALSAWELVDQVQKEGVDTRILVPLLSDLDFPNQYEECSAFAIDTWLKGLPKETQQEIERRKRSSFDPEVAKTSKQLSPEEVHSKLISAYRELMAEGRKASVGALSELAGVHWELALDWLKDRGIDNTQVLQVKIERGWVPDGGAPTKKKRRFGVKDSLTPLLFDLQNSDEEDSEPEDDAANPVPDETVSTEPDKTLPVRKNAETAPVPKTNAAVNPPTPADSEANPRVENQEGTLELVVEAQKSIFEGETPLTQTMQGPDAPAMDDVATNDDAVDDDIMNGNHVRLGIIVIIIFLLIAAISLVITFGLN